MTLKPTIFGIQFHPVFTVSVVLVILTGAFITLQQSQATDMSTSDQWPSFTMTYEAPGAAVSIGEQSLQPRETVRFRWGGRGDWRADVIDAESFDTGSAVGVVSTKGSWKSYDGKTLTTYNSVTGGTRTSTGNGDALINGLMHPTMSRVIRDDYEQRGTAPQSSTFPLDKGGLVDAITFGHGDGSRHVFTAEGIPLETPRGFRVLEFQID